MVGTYHYVFVKPTEYTTPRVNPEVNCRFRVIMTSSMLPNVSLWLGMMIMGGRGYTCAGVGAYGKFMYFPLDFAVNLNLLLKKK